MGPKNREYKRKKRRETTGRILLDDLWVKGKEKTSRFFFILAKNGLKNENGCPTQFRFFWREREAKVHMTFVFKWFKFRIAKERGNSPFGRERVFPSGNPQDSVPTIDLLRLRQTHFRIHWEEHTTLSNRTAKKL